MHPNNARSSLLAEELRGCDRQSARSGYEHWSQLFWLASWACVGSVGHGFTGDMQMKQDTLDRSLVLSHANTNTHTAVLVFLRPLKLWSFSFGT